MNINDMKTRIPPTFERRKEPVEEVRESRKIVSAYHIKPSRTFSIFNDGCMEMEYRGEEPVTNSENLGYSMRKEQIFPNTERHKEILETIKDMVLEPDFGFNHLRTYKGYITRELKAKIERSLELSNK